MEQASDLASNLPGHCPACCCVSHAYCEGWLRATIDRGRIFEFAEPSGQPGPTDWDLTTFQDSQNRANSIVKKVVVVQTLSRVWLFATPRTAARLASPSFVISWSLLKLVYIESMMSSNQLIVCSSLLLLPSIFPSIRVFSKTYVIYIKKINIIPGLQICLQSDDGLQPGDC